MPLAVDFDPYKATIITQYQADTKVDDIVTYLHDHHNLKITKRTLEKRLKLWGEQKNKKSTVENHENETLRLALITFYFYKRQASDKQILDMLNQKGLNTQPEFL